MAVAALAESDENSTVGIDEATIPRIRNSDATLAAMRTSFRDVRGARSSWASSSSIRRATIRMLTELDVAAMPTHAEYIANNRAAAAP